MQMAHTNNAARRRRQREAHARGARPRHRHHDRRQPWAGPPTSRSTRAARSSDYDIYWLEEPVPADDFKGYMRVADALPIRIVGGETHFTRFDLRPFFENPRMPILQPDPMRGGYHRPAQDRGARRHLGHADRAASVPRTERAAARLDPERRLDRGHGTVRGPLGRSGARSSNGMITAPERPGHGLAFKPEIMKDCKVS